MKTLSLPLLLIVLTSAAFPLSAAKAAAEKKETVSGQPAAEKKPEPAKPQPEKTVDESENEESEKKPPTPPPLPAIPEPVADTEAPAKKHYLRGGMIATNTFYMDPTINPGLYSGFFRPFGKYTYDEKWEFTARGNIIVKHYLQPFDARLSGPNTPKQTNVVGSLELLSGETRIGKHHLMAGRSFYAIEQGLLFANFADGVSYNGKYRYGQIRGFAVYSGDYGSSLCALNVTGCNGDPGPFVNTPNLLPDSGIQNSGKRLFFAAEYFSPEYLGGQLFSYAMLSRDLISETASTAKYAYNPWYAGIGARGYIVNSAYRYRGEFIYQGGGTYNQVLNGVSEATSISAFAAIVNFTWSVPILKNIDPQLLADVAMGSGDGDSTRVTNGSQSNTAGTYNAFQNFGSFSGGLALKPRLANMQVYRIGTYVRPFKANYTLRNLSAQFKYSYYRKTVAAGGISDPGASETNAEVGHAADIALVYNFKPDVQFFYGFGLFKPGTAYPEVQFDGSDGRAWRYAHLVSLTLIF